MLPGFGGQVRREHKGEFGGDFREAGTFEKDLEGCIVLQQAEKRGGANQQLAREEWKPFRFGIHKAELHN